MLTLNDLVLRLRELARIRDAAGEVTKERSASVLIKVDSSGTVEFSIGGCSESEELDWCYTGDSPYGVFPETLWHEEIEHAIQATIDAAQVHRAKVGKKRGLK